ncbi:MAG: exodeoxyribonuclease VII large subunit [Clostridiales bacterium]|nr:exodeoxyribonuclease VII large subunit [Clostridiales bacterium]
MQDVTPTVLTVTQLNAYVKSIIEEDFNLRTVFLVGEISNFTNHYRTGHLYMTIKDENCSIKAVMFRSSAQRLKFEPESGMSVIIRGRVSLFERDGQYQLYIDDMQPDGMGALSLAFEQLKKKLSAQGLFDEEHKKPLPRYPQKIGVVTSPTGAVLQDIRNVLQRRFPAVEIVLCPVEVQGANASKQIAKAIEKFNMLKGADVLIVGRGGGSMEDLWAFNEEIVARAVFDSEIPVISAVGHETDFTICDFVADLRAPTPSAAAELAVPEISEQKIYIKSLDLACKNQIKRMVDDNRVKLKLLMSSRAMQNIHSVVENKRLIIDDLINRMQQSVLLRLSDNKGKIRALCGKLDALSPLKVLARGYSVVFKEEKSVSSVKDIEKDDEIKIRMSDGIAECLVRKCNYEKNDL